MKCVKLNQNWNADPNSPEPKIKVLTNKVCLDFFLNYFIYDHINEGQMGQLVFNNCYCYRLGSPNDHGFYLNQFRYGPNDIKWGEFYELFDSNWQKDFPADKIILDKDFKLNSNLKHYLFFFRDNTFECIATGYEFKNL